MVFFGSKKNDKPKADAPAKAEKKPKAAKPVKAADATAKAGSGRDVTSVLKHPRITEKATAVSGANVYVFDVMPKATKKDVIEAVRHFYKAEPTKVNMTKVHSKRVFVRGTWGVKSGGKKAYVYFKEGQTIEII